MAIGTRLMFPSIAPIDAGAGDNNRRVSDGGLSRGRFNQHSAIISDAQPVQAELRRSKVIEAGLEIRDVTANQIQLDFVKRSGAGRGAKVNLAARILSLPSDAGGEIEQLSHGPQVGYRHCLGGNALGDRRQCGDSAWAYLAGQTQPLQRRINFERQWLVSPIRATEPRKIRDPDLLKNPRPNPQKFML